MKKFFLGLTLISSVSSFASCPKLVGDFKTCKVKEASIMGMEISAQELRQMPELASVIADTIKVEQSLEGKNTKYTITSTDMDAEEGVIEYVISKPTITLEDFDGVFVNLTEEAVCSDSGLELRESAVVARDAQENAEVSVEDMDLVDELLSDMKLNVILNLNKRRNLVMNYKMGKVMTAKVECSR